MSIAKWLTGGMTGGDARTTQRLEAELNELVHSVAPHVRDGTLRSLAVTSAEGREGRSRVAMYLVESVADALGGGERLLLIDANPRGAALHVQYKVANEKGLAEALRGEVALREVIRPTLRDNLGLVTIGNGGLRAGEVATRARIEDMLADVRSEYDLVVFETGPLMASPEAVVFCYSVDGVLLVVLAGITQGEIVARAHRLLIRSQSRVLGVVVNDPRGEFERDES